MTGEQDNTASEYYVEQLCYAIRRRDDSLMRDLVLQMSLTDLNTGNVCGGRPLNWACGGYNNQLAAATILGRQGVDVNVRDGDGFTSLMLAVDCCNVEIVELLLSKGAEMSGGLEELLMGRGRKRSTNLQQRSEIMRLLTTERRKREIKEEMIQKKEQRIAWKDGKESGVQKEIWETTKQKYTEKIDNLENDIQSKEMSISCANKIWEGRLKELDERQKRAMDTYTQTKEGDIRKMMERQEREMEELRTRKEQEKKELEAIHHIEKIQARQQNEMLKIQQEEKKNDLAGLKKRLFEVRRQMEEFELDWDNGKSLAEDNGKCVPDKGFEAAKSQLECPICLEVMKPPVKIWMCPQTHLVCEDCKDRMDNSICPTCRSDKVEGRAFFAENMARALFGSK